MPIGTPVHERTFALCESLNYREWSGYYAVSAYEGHHEHEYNAIRNASALIDVSPLFKYLVTGRDAARFVDRLITRDVSKMAVGQVYLHAVVRRARQGHRRRDGVAAGETRRSAGRRRIRACAGSARTRAGMNVTIEDISEEVAALALQGPTSARVLRAVVALPTSTA